MRHVENQQTPIDDPALLHKCLALNPGFELPHDDPRIYQAKPWINKEISYSSLAHYLETTAVIAQLFSRFVKEELTGNIKKMANPNFQNVLKPIQENIHQEISVRELAEMSFTSKDHFALIRYVLPGMAFH